MGILAMAIGESSAECDFLVLRTVPYGEGSVIATGLSATKGRLAFSVYGALGSGRRGSSPFGLFRRLHVSYIPKEREIQHAESADVIADYSALSRVYERYECACWISQFSLGNVLPGMPVPYYFTAVDVAYARLAADETPVAAIQTGLLVVFMEENGLLGDCSEDSRQSRQCQVLVDMALGGDVPRLTPQNWLALRNWAVSQLQQSECFVPVV